MSISLDFVIHDTMQNFNRHHEDLQESHLPDLGLLVVLLHYLIGMGQTYGQGHAGVLRRMAGCGDQDQ